MRGLGWVGWGGVQSGPGSYILKVSGCIQAYAIVVGVLARRSRWLSDGAPRTWDCRLSGLPRLSGLCCQPHGL